MSALARWVVAAIVVASLASVCVDGYEAAVEAISGEE